jgi:transposase
MFCLISPESRVPKDHPLRRIKKLVDQVLGDLSPLFEEMYAQTGRPSIPPERLLKAKMLQALYTVRSENLLIEALEYNLLFRWFLDLNLTDPVWDNSTFTKNQERLLGHQTAELFFARIVGLAKEHGWVSDEHFTVDGTLIDAWASLKSFQPKSGPQDPTDGDSGNPSVDFHGQTRSNATHQSTTDEQAQLARKGRGKEARLCYGLHALMENRNEHPTFLSRWLPGALGRYFARRIRQVVMVHAVPAALSRSKVEATLFEQRWNQYVSPGQAVEFIPIKSSAATGSDAPGSCAGHSRVPSPDRESPSSTAAAGL